MKKVIVVTTNDLSGYEIAENYGEVFGLVVRSRNLFSNIGAGLKTIVGGEIGAYTKLLSYCRTEAIERLKQEAASLGADAVLAFRFDTNITNGVNEVAAYGTAVKLKKR